jgi:hypothetical protein
MARQSFTERYARWQVLVANLKQCDGLVHIDGQRDQLEQLLGEAQTLENLKTSLRAQLQGITARLREISRQGDSLRSRLGAGLQWKFGFSSEQLIRFGFAPRQIPRRRKSKEAAEIEAAAVDPPALAGPRPFAPRAKAR